MNVLKKEKYTKNFLKKGCVWLIGAGPGDSDLLTLKALKMLKKADVIVFDYLISSEILKKISKKTICINVGKKFNYHKFKQNNIYNIIKHFVLKGYTVVRLKGGDPSIFGRAGEEIENLRKMGITCKIIPGITAAIGCAASIGIPLTHRELGQSVCFISGYNQLGKPNLKNYVYAKKNQTLIFYMCMHWIKSISIQLKTYGMSLETPIAIIENGTRINQRVIITNLKFLIETIKKEKPQSPTLLIIGEVVNIYKKFSSDTKKSDISYSFKK